MVSSTTEKASSSLPKNQGKPLGYEDAVLKYALSILGHGYNMQTEKVEPFGSVLENVAKKDLSLRDLRSYVNLYTGTENTKEYDKIRGSLGVSLSADRVTPIKVGSAGMSASKEEESQKGELLHLAQRVITCKSVLTGKNSVTAFKGDGFVHSATFLSGYQVSIRSTGKNKQKQTAFVGNLVLGLEGAGISAGLDSLKNQVAAGEKLIVSVQGFGGYVSKNIGGVFDDLEKVKTTLENIDEDFVNKLPELRVLDYKIDPLLDITLNNPFQQTNQVDKGQSIISHSLAQNETPFSVKNFPDFLSREVREFAEKDSFVKKTTLDLSLLYDEILKTFPLSLDMETRGKKGTCTLVLGPTGDGKSLFIGYMMGAKFIPLNDPGKKGLLEYDPENERIEEFPKIGHGRAKTKGCEIFDHYIDTAGAFDSNGRTMDICNTIAIGLGIRKVSPSRLIVLFNQDYLHSTRAHVVFEYLRNLDRILNIEDPKIASSIKFVFNPRGQNPKPKTQGFVSAMQSFFSSGKKDFGIDDSEIKAKLDFISQEMIKDLKEISPKLVTEAALSQVLSSLNENDQEPPTEILDLSPDKIKRAQSLQRDLRLLNLVRKNFSTVDFFSDNFRDQIKLWEKDITVSGLDTDDLTIYDFVENGKKDFQAILAATAAYFNHLQDSVKKLNHQIHSLDDDITAFQQYIKQSKAQKLAPDTAALQIQQMNIKQRLNKYEVELRECKEKLTSEKEKLRSLESTKETFLEDYFPHKRDAENLWWTYWSLTKPVTIDLNKNSHGEPVSILRAEPIADKTKRFPGAFGTDDKTLLAQGKYSVDFSPGWRRWTDDQSKIRLYIQEKDLPAWQAKRSEVRRTIEDPHTGLLSQVRSFEQKILAAKQQLAMVDDAAKLAKIQEDLQESQNEKNILSWQLKIANSILKQSVNFREQMINIIDNLNNIKTPDPQREKTQQELFDTFCNNFRATKNARNNLLNS